MTTAKKDSSAEESATPMTAQQVRNLGEEKGMQSPEFMDAMREQLEAWAKRRGSATESNKQTPPK